MSAQGLRELRKAIVSKAFEPAYYFHGDDEFRKEAAVRELIAGAVDPATRDFNFDLLRGGDVTPEQLASAVNTLPMMAERRVVVLRDVPALKKDARAVLERYLTRPSRDTVLILVAPAGTKPEKGLDHGVTALAFPVLRDQELMEWVARHAQEAHGVTMTDRAVSLLFESVGSDSGQMASEVDKLVSYTRGATIDEDAVAAVVGVRHGESLGDFLDRVAARDAAGALALIEHVLQLPKSGLVPIIIALSVQTLAIGWARQARDRGVSEARLGSELFGLLKETGAYPMRSWSEATECWKKHVARWDAASVERALEALLATDRAAKDTKLSSDDQLLASLVCAMCAPARRSAA